MNKYQNTFLIFTIGLLISCNSKMSAPMSEVECWKLGWRLIASSMDEDYQKAELQLDSLLELQSKPEAKFLVNGLEAKLNQNKKAEAFHILEGLDKETLGYICTKQSFTNLKPCLGLEEPKAENTALQLELVKMFINDQYARSNLMTDLLEKYNLKKEEVVLDSFGMSTDETNRNMLKEIISEYGFPTKKLVGKDAMDGIFLIIQHSDQDKEWQKSQLDNIVKAVEKGDMDGQSYAYLYDRIKVNGGEKQLYGTQFKNVDIVNKITELAPTEDLENLDKRRREIGMMPIDMYRAFMLKDM